MSTEYQYDNASRLTTLIYRNALGLLGDLTYQYDAAGNRTRIGGSFARKLFPDPVPLATYDAANRQLAFGDKAMTYDANGNLTTIADPGGPITFTWDARDRLEALSGPSTSALFSYDSFGHRITRMINTSTTQYHHDILGPLQELSTGQAVQLLSGPAIDEYLVRTDFGASLVFLSQALGSTLALVDSTGAIQTQYAYDPYGSTNVAGSSPNDRSSIHRARERRDRPVLLPRSLLSSSAS